MGVDPRDRRRLAVPAGLALLVLLAVVALAAGGRPLGISRGGNGPSGTFVDYAWTTLTIVVAVWIAVAIWLTLTFQLSSGQPVKRRRWWLTIPLMTVTFCVLALVIHALHIHPWRTLPGQAQAPPPQKVTPLRQPKGTSRNVAFRWEELVAVLAVLGLAGGIVAARRRGRLSTLPSFKLRAAQGVSYELDEAVDDLRADPDVRRAIIAAYARTERALARHGLPRRRSEAPLEYLERALGELDASATSIRRLTDLFEWAKFSHHDPEPGMKDEAIDALLAVRDELRNPVREPVPA